MKACNSLAAALDVKYIVRETLGSGLKSSLFREKKVKFGKDVGWVINLKDVSAWVCFHVSVWPGQQS